MLDAAREALVQQALALGLDEARARRVLSVLASTAEAVALLTADPERLANALLDAEEDTQLHRNGAPAQAAVAGFIDLTADSDEEARGPCPVAYGACALMRYPLQPPAQKRRREDSHAAGPSAALQAHTVAQTTPATAVGLAGQAAPAAPADQSASAAPCAANSLLAQMAAERHARHGRPPPAPEAPPPLEEVKLLTFNVWFDTEAPQEVRMRGIGELVVAEQPHIVCFQEVTPRIQTLFAAAAWWASYDVSDAPHGAPYYTLLLVRRPLHAAPRAMTRAPFGNSCQGRDLLCATLELGGGVRLMAATSHLESYMGPGATSSAERVEQMRQALQLLTHAGRAPANVVLAGDANWDDATDGDLARLLPPGWRDAWAALHPGEPGFTYDGPANAMLLNSLKKRLDRVLFRLADYEPAAVAMVGRAPLAGAFYEKRLRGGATKRLPVCCSDHFGLLFTMRRAPRRGATAA